VQNENAGGVDYIVNASITYLTNSNLDAAGAEVCIKPGDNYLADTTTLPVKIEIHQNDIKSSSNNEDDPDDNKFNSSTAAIIILGVFFYFCIFF
jgi:hypothetical protein